MKTLLTLATALSLVTHCALAADNLTCTGPFEKTAEAPTFTVPAGHLDPGEAGTICPQIPSNATIAVVACFVEIKAPPQPPAGFRCPVAASCPDVGTFQEIKRYKGPMGTDQICVTYVNQGETKQTYGIHITLQR